MTRKRKQKSQKPQRMYAGAKTWNPFVGCRFDCKYCIPSFQATAKRQRANCETCYEYEPHFHPERLSKIPKAEIVFVCGTSDLAFASHSEIAQILNAIHAKNSTQRREDWPTYYLQSKAPFTFEPFLLDLPSNVMIGTTLETNRDAGYGFVSKAPPPSIRASHFRMLGHPRKYVTVEPLIDFDELEFLVMLCEIYPETVWIGFNSRPKQAMLPEPHPGKVERLIQGLKDAGIRVRAKDLREVTK